VNRRRFLTAKEVQAMMQAARQGPTGERDYCLILLAFRHGMRISELLDLHYHDLDLHEGRVNVRRLKNGFSTIHPLRFDEREAIERWSQVRAGWKAAAKPTRCLSLVAVRRSHASRHIVLFDPPVKMRAPLRTRTLICCVTPAAMNWRKEVQIPV
jgi:integrase